MEHPQHGRPADVLARLTRGLPTGDPADDAAYSALLGTGMTPAAILAVLTELSRGRPLVRIA